MSPEVIDVGSFCYGAFAAVCVLATLAYLWWEFWPHEDDGVRALAKKALRSKNVN